MIPCLNVNIECYIIIHEDCDIVKRVLKNEDLMKLEEYDEAWKLMCKSDLGYKSC